MTPKQQRMDATAVAVGAVKDDGVVSSGQWLGFVLSQRHQVTDPVLHLFEQGRLFIFLGLIKQIDSGHIKCDTALLGIVKDIELADEIAPLPAPCRQERMGVGMHVLQWQGGEFTIIA